MQLQFALSRNVFSIFVPLFLDTLVGNSAIYCRLYAFNIILSLSLFSFCQIINIYITTEYKLTKWMMKAF